MIFILFVLIPRGIDNHEKCLTLAFYENGMKYTNILSPFNTGPLVEYGCATCWGIYHVNTVDD